MKKVCYNTSIAMVAKLAKGNFDIYLEEFDEELYAKRLEEEYDLFDQKYIRWLLLHHPDKVPSDWLQKVPTSSKQQVATRKGYQHVATLTYVYNKYCIVIGLQDNNHMEDSE